MKDGYKDKGMELRRKTPEVRLVTDAREAVTRLGPEAQRMLASLPKFRVTPVFKSL